MEVRALTTADIEQVLDLGREMHAESALKAWPFAEDRARYVLNAIIGHPDVFAYGAFREGEILGAWVAEMNCHLFVDVVFAKEVALYFKRSARGAMGAKVLAAAFEAWAKEKGSPFVILDISAGICDDRSEALFSRFGYAKCGTIMRKDL